MTDTFTPPDDQITADPTNGSKPIPGYGHGNQKAYDAALRRLEKQAKEWEDVAAEARAQIDWIDGEIARLHDEKNDGTRRESMALKVAKGLRERLPKETEG